MKKILSFIAASLASVASFAQVAPSVGSGSQEAPFKISNAEELLWFSNYVDSVAASQKVYAELIADIDLSTVCGEEIGTWKTIGREKAYFTGVFEGNGHSISNLYVTGSVPYLGLFGSVKDARISNLTIASGNLSSTTNGIGAVVGALSTNSVVENCHNYATVSTSYRFAGGVVGFIAGGAVVTRCHNEGLVSCGSSTGDHWGAGGIVGATNGGNVYNCYNLGTISGGSRCAGILGDFQGPSTIANCYNLGAIKCSKLSGQIVGYVSGGASSDNVTNNYSTSVAALEQFKSGEIAYKLNQGQDSTVWYQTIGQDSFPVFDATHLVVLLDTVKNVYCNEIDDEQGFGDGTIDNPFRISNADEMLWFSNYVDSIAASQEVYAELIADIDLSTVCGEEIGTWTPIGKGKTYFTGVFEGNGHSISNLYVTGSVPYLGLFGSVKDARISNLTIASGNLSSTTNGIGAVVGALSTNAVVENCHNYATVSTSYRFAGGIVGFIAGGGLVTRCHNEGLVSCGSSTGDHWGAGGIAGATNGGHVNNCYNLGTVSGGSRCAGILGDFQGSSSIANSYNLGVIKCSKLSGQIVGYVSGGASSDNVTNNYSTSNATLEQFKSGEIAYKLNQGQDSTVWYQTVNVDEYPVFDPSHGVVGLDSVNNVYTGVDEVAMNAVNVYAADHTIYVKGAETFRIFNILGIDETERNGSLNSGLYVVIADEKSYKVVVK